MSSTTKWDDAAVMDLTMAVLLSTNNGSLNIAANWDNVNETMTSWGYGFSKSAMNQHWSKKIVKQFKERHGEVKSSGTGDALPKTPNKTATPRKRATPKAPGTGRGKKRAAVNDDDDDETSPETHQIADPVAKQKTPRSVKKVKYEEDSNDEEAKAEALGKHEDLVELGEEMEMAAKDKAQEEEDSSY